MGKRGPPKQPTKLKIIRGNPGRQKLNKAEPEPPADKISPPPWLAGSSLERWNEVVPMLTDVGVMTNADVGIIARYCVAHELYLIYLAEVRAGGDRITGFNADGSVKYQQVAPPATLMNKYHEFMLRVEQEFGMTASARSGLVTNKEPVVKDDLEAFFTKHG